jgi:hypothetical protein
MGQYELALAALRSTDLEKSPILVWLQERTVLANQPFLNVFAVLQAQKKSNTISNNYSTTRNQERL